MNNSIVLENLISHSKKIDFIITRLIKTFSKQSYDILKTSENKYSRMEFYKKTFDIMTISLIELSNQLQSLNYDFIAIPILRLFSMNKLLLISFMKYSSNIFDNRLEISKIYYEDLLNQKLFYENEIAILKNNPNLISKNTSYFGSNINKYEKLEKATFYLHEEKLNLEIMLKESESGISDMTHFIDKIKNNVANIRPSHVKKLLYSILKSLKGDKLKDIDIDENLENFETDLFEQLKEELLTKLEGNSKKAITHYLSHTNRGVQKKSFDNPIKQKIVFSKEIQTDIFLEKKKVFKTKNEINEKIDELNQKNKKLEEKIASIKDDGENKNHKLWKKKEKIQKLKKEVEKLKNKLDSLEVSIFNDKIKEKTQKDKQIKETFSIENFKAKEKDYITIINEYENQNIELKHKLESNNEELQNITIKLQKYQSLLELYNLQYIDIEENDKILINSSSDLNSNNKNNQEISIIEKEKETLLNESFKIKVINRKKIITEKKDEFTQTDQNERKIKPISNVEELIFTYEIPEKQNLDPESDKKILKNEENIELNLLNSPNINENLTTNQKINRKKHKTMIPLSKNLINMKSSNNLQRKLSEKKIIDIEENKNNGETILLEKKVKSLQIELNQKNLVVQNLTAMLESITKYNNIDQNKEKKENLPKKELTTPKITNFNEENDIFKDKFFFKSSEIKKPQIIKQKTSSKTTFPSLSINDSQEKTAFNELNSSISNKSKYSVDFGKLMNNFPEQKKSIAYFNDLHNKKTNINTFKKNNLSASSFYPKQEIESTNFIEKEKKICTIHEEEENSLMKKELEQNENFSKIKFLFNYPFKSINKIFGYSKNKKESSNIDLFKDFYMRFLSKHEKCGPNCEHLKKFYKSIGILNKPQKKINHQIPKTIIDQLPILFQKDIN